VIDNVQPSSLGVKALQSLVVHPVHANNLGPNTTPGQLNTPACPSLKRFGLRYRRWLRSSERFDLILEIMSIIWSRQRSTFILQSFQIWTKSDQLDPLELIDGLSICLKGFNCLASGCAIEEEDFSDLVRSRLGEEIWENLYRKAPATPATVTIRQQVRTYLRASDSTSWFFGYVLD